MAATTRGRVPVPDLDDRSWADLAQGARALIPRYAPQWTDQNPSDIGITLVELFAWMVDALIFRLNQVPEKDYAAFLELMGARRDPAAPARAVLTFTATPPGPATVPAGTRVETRATEREPGLAFETDEAVTVQAANLTTLLFLEKGAGGVNIYRNLSAGITRTGAGSGAALLLQPGIPLLGLGFDQRPAQEVALGLEFARPLARGGPVVVGWRYSQAASGIPAVTPSADGTRGLTMDGVVRIAPPANWAAQPPGAWITPAPTPATPADADSTARHWLWILLWNPTLTPVSLAIRQVRFNAARAHAALTAGPAALGTSDGTPFQVFALPHAPLFQRPGAATPYDHLVVSVNGVQWTAVDEIPSGAGNLFRLDPVAGELLFGDHDSTTRPHGHGTIPALGAQVVATSFRYVASGTAGNVGGGTIVVPTSPLAGVAGVTNHGPAEDGADEEPIEDAKRRAPQALRTRSRAVTDEDYEYLGGESTDVACVRCLPPRLHFKPPATSLYTEGTPWMFGGIDRSLANVNVIVVPRTGPVPERPDASPELLRRVQAQLDAHRDVTARLLVSGPRYVPVRVDVEVHVWQQAKDKGLIASEQEVYDRVDQALRAFLHPITGGPTDTGWDVGEHVYVSGLYAAAVPDPRLGYIAAMTVQAEIPLYHFPPIGTGTAINFSPFERPDGHQVGIPSTWVRIADYELACAGQIILTGQLDVT